MAKSSRNGQDQAQASSSDEVSTLQHNVVPQPQSGANLPFDLAGLPPHEREALLRMIYAAGSAAAAALQAENNRHEEKVPEFYGRSPTDLTRQFSTLPRPAQGGGSPKRKV